MSSAPPTIAAMSTLAMVRTAESRGVATADLLAAAGLTRDGLEDPDARLPAPTVFALWQALRERTGDAELHLAAPESLPFGAYQVMDFLVASAATVGDGVRHFATFFALIANTVSLTIEADGPGGGQALCLVMASGAPVPPMYVDYIFAALVSRMRMRIQPRLEVARLELRRDEPPGAARYAAVFQAPVRFGAMRDRLCFSAGAWATPTATADEALARLMQDHARALARRHPGAPSSFLAEVQRAIAAVLSRHGGADEVARALNVSVRTLQRRLDDGGTTFRAEVDAVRQQLAEEYLADRRVGILEVAFLLGFRDQTAFNRAFRRWTGQAPGRWRRERR